ncbi:MAG: DUF6291 domain-containing protein [Clostridiales bacterium]|nr:DUF6291 domain-containing protein [Clostridiales bacterium]
MLTDAQMGQLFRAMLQFSQGKDPAPADPLVMMAFSFVRPSMERDAEKYKRTCEKRRAAGTKGGRPKKQKEGQSDFFSPESKRFDKPTKEPDNDNVNDNENDNVYDNVNVNGPQSMGGDGGTETPDEDAENAQEIVQNPVENDDDVKDVENYCKKNAA